MVGSVNSWAGMVQSGYITINGRSTFVTVQNGTLAEAQLLESGQPLTASQQSYLDANYHEGDDGASIPGFSITYQAQVSTEASQVQTSSSSQVSPLQVNAAALKPKSGGAQFSDIPSNAAAGTPSPAQTASTDDASDLQGAAFCSLVENVKILNANNGNFNFLERFGAGPQR